MQSREYFYAVELKRYVVLYFLLGVVEHEFRARVPIALSDAAFTLGKLDWWACGWTILAPFIWLIGGWAITTYQRNK